MGNISTLIYLDSAGFHYPDYPTLLAWYTTQYQNIYGSDIYLGADSQDGQWLAIQVQSMYDLCTLQASVINSYSPATAQGTGLSTAVQINGLERINPTFSTADLTIVGTVGTTITNGIAVDTLSQQWILPATVTIPGGGSIVVTATAQAVGAINAAAATITTIFTPTLGWLTVNNVAAATVGVAVESDAALRARQAISTANPSLTVFDGTIGAVENVAGVTEVQGYENDTDSTDGNGLPPHAISIVAQGGDAATIAQTIAIHKGPGCNTYGSTSETVYDSRGLPSTINFYRPTVERIVVAVTIVTNPSYTSAYAGLIQTAVANFINGLGIGKNVIISQMYAPSSLAGTVAGTSFYVSEIQVSVYPASVGSSNLTLTFNELANCLTTDVTVIT